MTKMTKLKGALDYLHGFVGFHRDVKLILASNTFSAVNYGIFYVTQTLYLNSLGYDPATIGFLVGLTTVFSILFLIPAGIIADRISKKWILIASSLAYLFTFIIYAFFEAFPYLLLASLLSGFSWGTYVAPFNALIADKVESATWSYAFSISAILYALGSLVGSFLAGFSEEAFESILHLTPASSYRLIFLLSIAFGTATLLPIIPIREHRERITTRWNVIKSRKAALKFCLINGLIGLGAGLFVSLLPLYLNVKFSASDMEIGVLFAVSSAITGFSWFVAPKLMERIGPVKSTVLAQTPSIVLLLLVPFSSNFVVAALLLTIRSVLMNFATPIITTYTMNLVAREERALVSGITTMAWNGANALGTMLAGQFMETYLDLPVFLCGMFYAISIPLFYVFFKGEQKTI